MSFKDMKLRSGVGLLASRTGFTEPHTLPANVTIQLDNSVRALSRNMKRDINREDYLTWVETWKKLYASVSTVIHTLKQHRGYTAPEIGNNIRESIRSCRQSDVHTIRRHATHLLEMRAINKILAGQARERNLYKDAIEAALADMEAKGVDED